MKSIDKKRFESEIQKQIEEIEKRVFLAGISFVKYKKEPNLKNYLEFKKAVISFYQDDFTINSEPYRYVKPKTMLKTFRSEYPKQFKTIEKRLLKSDLDYTQLLEAGNAHLEMLLERQATRKVTVNELKKSYEENYKDLYSPRIMEQGFAIIDKVVEDLEKDESLVINPKYTTVDYFALFDKSMIKAVEMLVSKTESKVNVVEKSEEVQSL
jgi:hypothetical protein